MNIYPPPLFKFQQTEPVKKSILCVATLSALAMMSGATVANGLDGTTNTDKAGNWSLTKWTSTSGSVVDFDASLHDLSGDNKTLSGQIKGVMDQAMIDQIRGKQPFEEFASVGKKDVWTDVSGIFKSNGNAATITNASINLEMVAGATADNLDVVGINNMGGTLNFEGVTNVVVKQNGTAKGENNDYDNNGPDPLGAVGYISIDSIVYEAAAVVTNFNGDTSFDIENNSKGGTAVGIISAANDPMKPTVNVKGNLNIQAKSDARAYGVYNIYSDWNLGQNPSIDNPGAITVDKNLTIAVSSANEKAYGLISEIGNVTVKGNTDITAEGKAAHGIYVTSNGHIYLHGDSTTVTAENALTIKVHEPAESIDDNGIPWKPNTLDTSVSILSKTTTLNGTTSTEEGTKLYVANTVNFNGDADIQGLIMADADATLKIADGKTLTFGDSKNVESNTFKNLTLEGGTFNNASQMTVNGTLTLENIKAENLKNNTDSGERQSQIEADKVVFGNGATFRNKGSFHAKHWVFGEGSVFMEEENTWKQEDGTLRTKFSDYTTELAGGVISTIESNGAEKLAVIELVTDADAKGGKPALNNGVLMVTNGAYDFDTVTINISPDTQGLVSPKRFMVSGAYTTLNVRNFNATKGNASITDGSTFTVGTLKANGAFELDAQSAKSFTVKNFKGAEGGDFKLTGGTMDVGSIDLTQGVLTIGGSGTLATGSDQIFMYGLGADGKVTNAGGLKHGNNLVFETNSSLTLNDKFYNFDYVNGAKDALGANDKSMTVIFSGKLVDDFGNVRDETGIDSVPDGTVHEETDIAAKANTSGIVTIDKSVGGQTLVVDKGNEVALTDGKTLTLVGSDNASGELINFKDAKGDKIVTASGERGGITLGSESGMKKGTLSATVDLTQNATLTAQNGTFTVEAVKARSANIAVTGGELTVNKLDVAGTSAISSGVTGKTKVAELSVGTEGTTTVTGAVSADKIVAAGNAVINIGKTGTAEEGGMRGDLTIGEGSIKGLTFFLDPTWVEGKEVTDASRLVLNRTTVDGNVIVGENSYVVLGTDSDAEFVKLFNDKTLTWGKGEGRTLAAAYVAKPIDVTAGSLVVEGTLTSAPANEAAGTVKFAAGSVLVADVTDLTTDKALITGTTFDVDAASKAVIIGQLKNGETYKLTTDADSNFWNTEETLVAGNKLWDFTVNEDGSFTTKLTDAALVYGDLMQGHELANAATEAGNAYGNELLTETEGLSNAAIAARFDAAMNTAGAAAVFTTAYDRASELRDAVRGEALEGEGNRLWAQVTGGKTKLNGLSSGAQSIHVDTDAYGLVVGGDVALSNGVLGAAFTAGTGDSENDDVGVKDDFDFYGLSVYGKTSVGGIDLLADGSMTFVKSDLTMGGVADVDTDTTTAVYSLGVQAQRTWDYVVAITPFVGMDIYHVRGDGYDNGHGAQVDDAHATAVEFPIGATIAKAFETNGFKLSPNFSFAVVPTVGDRDIDSKVRFAGAESTYNFTFADDVKVRTNLGFAAEKDNFRFGLNAGYDWGNEERSATKLMLNAQYRF